MENKYMYGLEHLDIKELEDLLHRIQGAINYVDDAPFYSNRRIVLASLDQDYKTVENLLIKKQGGK